MVVVGEIKPPAYRDPVQMLRNLADDIEAGKYGDVETVVIATAGSAGYDTFGGGRDSGMHACTFLFGAAHQRMLSLPWGGE